jgi:hypothetical protein
MSPTLDLVAGCDSHSFDNGSTSVAVTGHKQGSSMICATSDFLVPVHGGSECNAALLKILYRTKLANRRCNLSVNAHANASLCATLAHRWPATYNLYSCKVRSALRCRARCRRCLSWPSRILASVPLKSLLRQVLLVTFC